MKNISLLFCSLSLFLIACGGGSGGGDGGGFQPKAPKIDIIAPQLTIVPNPTRGRLGSIGNTSVAMIDVNVTKGSRPLETGNEEVYVQTLAESTVTGYIYCFNAENKDCLEETTDSQGNKIKVRRPLSGTPINLNAGRGSFAVTAANANQGYIYLKITATGQDGTSSTKKLKINVKYKSTGQPYQMSLFGANSINPNVPINVAVNITDEAGNPINNPDNNNLIVTASNLNGVTLGYNGKTGQSVNAKTNNGTATISVLATKTGFLTLTAQGDKSDNNIGNGIQSLISATKVIRVTNDTPVATGPIQITNSAIPDGVVGIPFTYSIPTRGAAVAGFTVNAGDVPPGLNLSNSGVLSGTPSLAGTYQFTVTATGVNATTSSRNMRIKIVNGGLKFTPEAFEAINIPSKAFCVDLAQTLRITPTGDYTLNPEFKWTMDAVGVRTALGTNKAVPLKNANGVELTGLEFTVAGNSQQVTMNGKACRDQPQLFNGHGIILSVTDANGFSFRSVVPLVIGKEAYKPDNGSGSGGGGSTPDKCDGFSPTPPSCTDGISLAEGKVGEDYAAVVAGSTVDYALINGTTLPPGLSLIKGTSNVVITGKPTKAGTYTFALGDGKTSKVITIVIK